LSLRHTPCKGRRPTCLRACVPACLLPDKLRCVSTAWLAARMSHLRLLGLVSPRRRPHEQHIDRTREADADRTVGTRTRHDAHVTPQRFIHRHINGLAESCHRSGARVRQTARHAQPGAPAPSRRRARKCGGILRQGLVRRMWKENETSRKADSQKRGRGMSRKADASSSRRLVVQNHQRI
jgi:hypothetical protein